MSHRPLFVARAPAASRTTPDVARHGPDAAVALAHRETREIASPDFNLAGASALLGVQLANAALAYVVTAVLTRVLDPSAFGGYSFVLAFVSVVVLPAQFGIPSLIVREVAAANARGSWALMKGLVRWAHQLVGVMAALSAVAAGSALLLVPRLRGVADLPTLLWGLLLVPLWPLAGVRGAILRGLRRPAIGQLPEQVLRPALFILLLLIGGRAVGRAATAMALNVATTAVAFVVGVLLFLRFRPASFDAVPAEYDRRRWLLSLVPLGLSNSMNTLSAQVGILLLGFLAAPADVAVYRVVSQTALFAGVGYTVLNATISADFAAAFVRGDRRALQRNAVLGSRTSLAVGAPLILAFWLFGRRILGGLFGAPYAVGYEALAVLSLSYLISMAFGSAAALLNMTHHERDVTHCVAVSVVVNVGLSVALVPPFGVAGAAWATVASALYLNVALWRYAKRRLGVESAFWGRA